MLIVAGLHFAWKTGNFAEFEKTFLFHRGESIRLASKFLGHGSTRTSRDCMKLVAALSLVEVGEICTAMYRNNRVRAQLINSRAHLATALRPRRISKVY